MLCHPRELALRKGEIVYILKQIDNNWYEGESHGQVGIFPISYVEVSPLLFSLLLSSPSFLPLLSFLQPCVPQAVFSSLLNSPPFSLLSIDTDSSKLIRDFIRLSSSTPLFVEDTSLSEARANQTPAPGPGQRAGAGCGSLQLHS